MTDPRTVYERRDELRAQDHDALQAVLHILRDVLGAQTAQRESVDRFRERMDEKLEKQDAKIDRMSEHLTTLAEQLRQADRGIRADLDTESRRPRFALIGEGAARGLGYAIVAGGALALVWVLRSLGVEPPPLP